MRYQRLRWIVARVRGTCRICGKKALLDPHHIISQGHAKKTGQKDLISNPGNVVHICRNCHDQTTASKSYRMLNEEYKGKPKKTVAKSRKCSRCGRTSHTASSCYAKTHANGKSLSKKKSTPKKTTAKKAAPKKKSSPKKKSLKKKIGRFVKKTARDAWKEFK